MSTLVFRLSAASLMALLASCSSTEPNATARDASGTYATSSNYNSSQRSEFKAAMVVGLDDYDRRRGELEARASRLGQAAIDELHAYLPSLIKKRTTFVNESARLDAALDKDWPARREATKEAYDDLRSTLDEAFEAVLT